jgi:hypothetical protein
MRNWKWTVLDGSFVMAYAILEGAVRLWQVWLAVAICWFLLGCAPAAKIGTGLDCWPDCREEERDAE